MLLENVHIDNAIKFEHSEKINSVVVDNNAVGATKNTEKRTLPFTPSDTNSIFVSKSGSDSNSGTSAQPCLTIKYAVSLCTATKEYVVVNDDSVYYESQIDIAGNCKGIVANIGCSPIIKPSAIPLSLNLESNATSYMINFKSVSPVYGAQVLLSDGNIAVIYTVSSPYAFRIRIYNNSFTVVISDNLLFSGASGAYSYPQSAWSELEFIVLQDKFVALLGIQLSGGATTFYKTIVNNDGTLFSNTDLGTMGTGYRTDIVQGKVYGNKYYWLDDRVDGYYPTFRIYENNTLKYSVTGTGSYARMKFMYADSNYAWVICQTGVGSSIMGTIYKINLTTYVATTTTITCSTGWFLSWTTNFENIKNSIFKSKGKYYVISKSTQYNILYLAELDFTTFLQVGSNPTQFDNALADRTYPIVMGTTIHQLTDTLILITSGYSNGGVASTVYTILDMTDYDASRAWGDRFLNYACFKGQTCVPDNIITYQLSLTKNFFYITDDFHIIFRFPGLSLSIFDVSIINATNNSIINGITLDADERPLIRNIIKTTGDSVDIQNCDLINVYNEPNSIYKFSADILKSSASTSMVFKNNKVKNGSFGLNISGNNILFEKNILNKINDSAALTVTGSGANVIIKNNTFHNNHAGVELIGNNGSEIVKNNIFNNNIVFGVKVATALSIINSCCTDSLIVATLHSSSTTLNPMFKDNGYVNPDLLDLHLQSNYEGYAINSPALVIGDDGFDAGCYNTTATISPPTYTSFFIPKPKKIELSVNPVNELLNTMQDGSVESRVDAFQMQVDLDYDSLKIMYIKDLLKMIMAGGEIRIYFNPYSDESLFESYHLKHKDNQFSNDLYLLAEYGFKNIKLSFVRKFDISELS